MNQRTKNNRGTRPTLKLIAERTGLAITTVSKALRGQGNLNAQTIKRVQAVAKEVGYSPDRAGVRLRTGQSSVIAIAIDHSDDISDFERRIVSGISSALSDTHYELSLTPIFPHTDQIELFRKIATNRLADGIIFNNTHPQDERIKLLTDMKFPFVTHGRSNLPTPHAYYDFDNEEFAYLAAKRLAAKGAKRIALASGSDILTYQEHAQKGVEQAQREFGVEIEELIVRPDTQSFAMTLHGEVMRLAKDGSLPDGIISSSDIGSLALIDACAEAGLTVGRDVHVISRRTSSLLDFSRPRVDTISEDLIEAGETIARLLLRHIDGEAPENLQIIAHPIVNWDS